MAPYADNLQDFKDGNLRRPHGGNLFRPELLLNPEVLLFEFQGCFCPAKVFAKTTSWTLPAYSVNIEQRIPARDAFDCEQPPTRKQPHPDIQPCYAARDEQRAQFLS